MADAELTFDRPHRPLPVRLLNAVGRALARFGLRGPSLEEAALMAAAERETGLGDWDDPSFRPWLTRLLNNIEREVPLTLLGRIMLRKKLLTLLTNRLKVRDTCKRMPEILEVPVERPIFIVGFPRTGTTLLYQLLALDVSARAPRLWEATRPAPPPTPETADSDPRIREVEKLLRGFYYLSPRTDTIHALRAREPEECYYLLESSFFSLSFAQMFDLPDYWKALLAHTPEDALEPYRRYRRQLQILMRHYPGKHWVSKSPVHLFGLDALLEVFPDARILITHRDPLECIPSAGSLVSSVRSLFIDDVDPPSIGRFLLECFEESARRAEAAEAAHPEACIEHLAYDELVADPVGTLERLHDRWGTPMTEAHRSRARDWMREHPQHAHGVHRYSLEQFGLSADRVREAVRGVRQR